MTTQPQANAGRVYSDLAPLNYLTAQQNLYRNTPDYQEMLARNDFDNLVKAQYNRIRPAPAITGNYFAMKGALMRRTRTALYEDKVAVYLSRNARAYDDSFSDRVIKATMALLRYNGRLQRSREQSKRRQTKTESRTCQYRLTALLSADKLNAPNLKELYTGTWRDPEWSSGYNGIIQLLTFARLLGGLRHDHDQLTT